MSTETKYEVEDIIIVGKFEVLTNDFVKFIQSYGKKYRFIFACCESKCVSFKMKKIYLESFLMERCLFQIITFEDLVKYESVFTANAKLFIRNCEKEFPCKFLNLEAVDVPYYFIQRAMFMGAGIFGKIKSLINEKRYRHSISVVLTALELAAICKYHPSINVIRAAILHDIAKDLHYEHMETIMKECFPEYLNENEEVYHQFAGVVLAEKMFDIHDEEVLDAIKYHTTANKDMSLLAKIIFCADKIEPMRTYENQGKLDKACRKDINEGFILTLMDNIRYLNANDIKLSELTLEAFKFYSKEINRAREAEKMYQEDLKTISSIARFIESKKGENVTLYDYTERELKIADYQIVATALNNRHLSALADETEKFLKENNHYIHHIEGNDRSGWIIIDCGNLIIHLFTEQERNRLDYDHIYLKPNNK